MTLSTTVVGGCLLPFLVFTISSPSPSPLSLSSSFFFTFKINVKYMAPLPLMGLLNLLHFYVSTTLIVSSGLLFASVDSTLLLHILKAPPLRSKSSSAVFKYSLTSINGSTACTNNGHCSFYCQIDGKSFKPCSPAAIVLRNLTANQKHSFVLNVTTHDGESSSSTFSWFIDTIPPTASISSQWNYTNAEKVAIDVTFSEPCTGRGRGGGFKCVNSSHCHVILNGPAHVSASSLRVLEPNIKYRLDVSISTEILLGRVIITMADKFCTDQAGNGFTRTNGSILIIRFDRRPLVADLWTSAPSYELGINGVPRTVFATNDLDDLKIFLDFSIPVMNSTEQVLRALHISSGYLVASQHGNRRFAFKLMNVSETEIVTVEIQEGQVIGRTGSPLSAPSSLTFLYDSTKPSVGLSSSTPSTTKESSINVIVEFTKPVFGFVGSMMTVSGGKLIRFKDLSRALYSLTISAETQNVVSVTVPAGVVTDVAGNSNLASNQIEVKHYSVPATSIALYSFMTVGILTTSLAAAVLSISSANLGAIGSLASHSTNAIASDPSMNIHGMVGHLQVFVLSDWLSANLPVEYSETAKGLRWLVPRHKLPWKRDSSDEELKGMEMDSKFGLVHGHGNFSIKNSPYGLPLDSNEYFSYFLRGEPLSANIVVERMESYNGWHDLEMNMFWLGLGCGILLIIHGLVLLFIRWRTGNPAHGILSVPRFEIFLLIVAIPCISQSSAFVIRGGTAWGIITGSLLIAIPIAFIISVCLFLAVATSTGSFAQYKEVKHEDMEESWLTKLWFFFTCRPATGKWFYKESLPSSFLPRFGILFESRKGPPSFVYVDQSDPNTIPVWTGSGHSGIGRMKAVSSDDSNEEMKIPTRRRVFGCARSFYIVVDLLRRAGLGIVAGAYPTQNQSSQNQNQNQSQSIIALAVTLAQFMCLVTLKPYIRRGVYAVECISLLCEAGVFGLSLANTSKGKSIGIMMLALLIVTFVSHIVNEWYALINGILRLSQTERSSLRLGLKFAAKGLVLPFLPRRHWPRIIPQCSIPKTGLTSVPPLSPETDTQARDTRPAHVGAMNATIVPVLSPGEPGPSADQTRSSAKRGKEGQGQRRRGLMLEKRNELRKLRELAKASFSGGSKEEEASGSFGFKAQSSSDENQASSSRINY